MIMHEVKKNVNGKDVTLVGNKCTFKDLEVGDFFVVLYKQSGKPSMESVWKKLTKTLIINVTYFSPEQTGYRRGCALNKKVQKVRVK